MVSWIHRENNAGNTVLSFSFFRPSSLAALRFIKSR